MVFLPSMQSYIVLQAHVYALFASDARFARTRRTRIYWGWCNPYLFLYLSVRQVFVGKRYTTPIWKFKKEQLNVGLWWGFKQLDCNGNSVTLRDTAVLAIDNNSIDSYTKQPGTLSNQLQLKQSLRTAYSNKRFLTLGVLLLNTSTIM